MGRNKGHPKSYRYRGTHYSFTRTAKMIKRIMEDFKKGKVSDESTKTDSLTKKK